MPALMMFSRTRARPASVGSKSTGNTSPAAMPSSTTSMKRTLGVRIEKTWVRSTPGRKKVASVTSRSTAKNSGVNMSPSRAISAMTTRSAPPNSSRYSRKVRMYSCSSGTSLVKPASTRSPVASHPIARVTIANTAITRRRRAKSSSSRRSVTWALFRKVGGTGNRDKDPTQASLRRRGLRCRGGRSGSQPVNPAAVASYRTRRTS